MCHYFLIVFKKIFFRVAFLKIFFLSKNCYYNPQHWITGKAGLPEPPIFESFGSGSGSSSGLIPAPAPSPPHKSGKGGTCLHINRNIFIKMENTLFSLVNPHLHGGGTICYSQRMTFSPKVPMYKNCENVCIPCPKYCLYTYVLNL